MANDVISIWNLALEATGASGDVSSESENSPSANRCRTWYPLVRQTVIKAASWPCAKKHVRLSLLAERDFAEEWTNTSPAPMYKYSYMAPADMLAPRNLANYARFEMSYITDKQSIDTNTDKAVLTYIFDQELVARWDIGLKNAVIYALAAAMSTKVSGKFGMRDRLVQQAQEVITAMQTQTANEQDTQYQFAPPNLIARGYDFPITDFQYFYPYETLSGLFV